MLWFTGQNGVYGSARPEVGQVTVYDAPRGAGPYGITTTPSGDVYYASLAGNYVGRINTRPGRPRCSTADAGKARGGCGPIRWADLGERMERGQVARYDPARAWREWPLPGPEPMPTPCSSTRATSFG